MEECNVHCLGGISHALFSDSSTNVQQGPHLGKAGKETQGIQIQYEGFGGPRCCFCLTPPMDHVSASSNAPMDHLMDLSKNSFLVSPDMSILRIIYYCIYINIYICVCGTIIYMKLYIYINPYPMHGREPLDFGDCALPALPILSTRHRSWDIRRIGWCHFKRFDERQGPWYS